MDAKYIIFDVNGLEVPIIFPPTLEHLNMKTYVPGHWLVVSAGFVCTGDDELVKAHGESISLKVESRKGDTAILTRMLAQ